MEYIDVKEKAKEIRKELKNRFGYNSKDVSVKIRRFSMGEAIDSEIKSERALYKRDEIKKICEGKENIHRDQFGEILGGGNTYSTCDVSWELQKELEEKYKEEIEKAMKQTESEYTNTAEFGGQKFFKDTQDKFFKFFENGFGRDYRREEMPRILILNMKHEPK